MFAIFPIFLHTNASAIGAILMQPNDDGQNQVVAYFSRRLNCHEARYSVSELEFLAMVDEMEKFHVYVHGQHVHIFSDHSALQWLFSIKKSVISSRRTEPAPVPKPYLSDPNIYRNSIEPVIKPKSKFYQTLIQTSTRTQNPQC